MAEFDVYWSIRLDAESAENAAEEALAIFEDPGNTATVFRVIGDNGSILYDASNCAHMDNTELSPQEAVRAIRARLSGIWDDPSLQKLGELHPNLMIDIGRILDMTA